MRLLSISRDGDNTIAVRQGDCVYDLRRLDPELPASLDAVVVGGPAMMDRVRRASERASPAALVPAGAIVHRPLIERPGKIVCIGRNYAAHAREGGAEPPAYPEVFFRGATSLIGHGQPLVRPRVSDRFDFEGELAVVIGRTGRHVARAAALDHVLGYALFNDGTLRDYQRRTSQWTIGKNFDGTGAFGPELVTADELPPGAAGLTLVTRLNGEEMQRGHTDDLIFPVAALIETLTECLTLEAGDVIVTGTPAGVGYARTPPVFLKPGDVVEIEMAPVGVLRNGVVDEAA